MKRLHVQLTPQIHEGRMAYYWHIDLHADGHQFTLKHGWASSYGEAMDDAYDAGVELGAE